MDEQILDLLGGWVMWEERLLMDDKAWIGEYPCFNQDLYDQYMILQGKRNKTLNEYRKRNARHNNVPTA